VLIPVSGPEVDVRDVEPSKQAALRAGLAHGRREHATPDETMIATAAAAVTVAVAAPVEEIAAQIEAAGESTMLT
jgi:hypothetical protein